MGRAGTRPVARRSGVARAALESWPARLGICILAAACSDDRGLLMFDVSRADGVPAPDSIVVQVNDRVETFAGGSTLRPALRLSEGDYAVRVSALAQSRMVAEETGLRAHVDPRAITSLKVHLGAAGPSTIPDGGNPGGGGAGGQLGSGGTVQKDAGGTRGAGGRDAMDGLDAAVGSGGGVAVRSADGGARQPDATSGDATTMGWARPPCLRDASANGSPVSLFTDDFETYPPGSPYDPPGTPWVRASIGRDAQLVRANAHSGSQSLLLDSLTVRSEIAYVRLPITAAPDRLSVSAYVTPDGFATYEDFLELGLGYATSKFDLTPTVAINLKGHRITINAQPKKPATDGNGHPGVVVYDEFDYGIGSLTTSYLRFDLDFCAAKIDVYVGADATAPYRGSASFDARHPFNSFYVAGGLNTTYVDDVSIAATPAPK